MELYEFARPTLMSGKKILYVHGFASSGQSGTVKTLRLLLPGAEVIAPDIPVDPHEAIAFLENVVAEIRPNLVIGTSMGGMYAEHLHGIDRILVNPAFQIAETILKTNGLGRHEFHNPRQDGQKDFLVTKGTLEAFRDVSGRCFSAVSEDEKLRVFALFGTRDPLVHTRGLTREHYPQCIDFDGEHQLNDSAFLHAVLPVIQWIDDRQRGVIRQTIVLAFDDVLRYRHNGEAVAAAVKAVEFLAERFDLQFVLSGEPDTMDDLQEKRSWLSANLSVASWRRLTITSRKDLLLGDFLVDAHPDEFGGNAFMGTVIEFGSPDFKGWGETMTFFARICGETR